MFHSRPGFIPFPSLMVCTCQRCLEGRQGDAFGGMSKAGSAQLHPSHGYSTSAAGTPGPRVGNTTAWGLSSSSSFSQIRGKANTAAFPCCQQEPRSSLVPRTLQPFPALQSQPTPELPSTTRPKLCGFTIPSCSPPHKSAKANFPFSY